MPVSFLPLLLPLIAIVVMAVSAFKGMKVFLRATLCVVVVFLGILSIFYIPGVYLYLKASSVIPPTKIDTHVGLRTIQMRSINGFCGRFPRMFWEDMHG